MLKQKVVFLLCGESRCNPLSFNKNPNSDILTSLSTFIFTEEFKKQYDYTIYISTDDIHLENTISYFGREHISNIHLINTNYYLKPIKTHIPNSSHFLNIYNTYPNPENYRRYPTSILQYHRLLDAYNLFKNDSCDCDWIIRMRWDCIFSVNIMDILKTFENNPKQEIVTSHDHFAVGKKNIMNVYCNTMLHKYGKYKFDSRTHTPVNLLCQLDKTYPPDDLNMWTYAPEIQLFETLFEYCIINSLDMESALIPMKCCKIVR